MFHRHSQLQEDTAPEGMDEAAAVAADLSPRKPVPNAWCGRGRSGMYWFLVMMGFATMGRMVSVVTNRMTGVISYKEGSPVTSVTLALAQSSLDAVGGAPTGSSSSSSSGTPTPAAAVIADNGEPLELASGGRPDPASVAAPAVARVSALTEKAAAAAAVAHAGRSDAAHARSRTLAPHGVDPQVSHDLSPWVGRGISAEDLHATKTMLRQGYFSSEGVKGLYSPPALPLPAAVAEELGGWIAPSDGVFTVIIKSRVVYFMYDDARANSEILTLPGRAKVGSLYLMLSAIMRRYPVPDVQFLWNVNPSSHLRPASMGPRPLVEAEGGSTASTGVAASTAAAAAATAPTVLFTLGPETAAMQSPAPPGLAPLFSMCKTPGDYDVLTPNVYFRTPHAWNATAHKIGGLADASPWTNRSRKIWWRGASGDEWPAASARVTMIGKWHGREFTDFAFTNNFGTVWNGWVRRKAKWVTGGLVPARTARAPFGEANKQQVTASIKFRYALHLPGSFRGTYSRALQYLLWTGTTIFLYDAPYFEFYYHGLRPWVHYIPVNLTNLEERWRWAEHHQRAARGIAEAARAFAHAHLHGGSLSAYWVNLLRNYARLQTFDARDVPSGACGCWAYGARPAGTPRTVIGHCPNICDPGPTEEYLKERFASGKLKSTSE